MNTERERGPTLRLELFVADLRASLDFYQRVLGFEKEAERPGGYTPLTQGAVRLALNRRSDLDEHHPIRVVPHERPGRGVEIVLEVDDVGATYRRVVAANWRRSAELTRRSWGLTDFRLVDPDGYYWRVTSRD
jgi:lactoylglutathione lyase